MGIPKKYVKEDPYLGKLIEYVFSNPKKISLSSEEFTKDGEPWLRLRFEGRDCYIHEFVSLAGMLLPRFYTEDNHGRTVYDPDNKIAEYEIPLSETELGESAPIGKMMSAYYAGPSVGPMET